MMKIASPLNFQELSDLLPENTSSIDRELIHRAYKVAEKAHQDQKRVSGEPYINHCLAVAAILIDLGMPAEVISAALLHDTVEDTSVT